MGNVQTGESACAHEVLCMASQVERPAPGHCLLLVGDISVAGPQDIMAPVSIEREAAMRKRPRSVEIRPSDHQIMKKFSTDGECRRRVLSAWFSFFRSVFGVF